MPALGIRIGQCIKPQHSGVLGYLIMSCQTLADALLRFQRYQRLLHNYSSVALQGKGDCVEMSWDVDQGLSTQLSDEVFLAGLVTFIRDITGRPDLTPVAIQFTHTVPYAAADYERLMGCAVRFAGARVAIEFQLATLALPINTHNTHLLALLERQADAMVGETQHQDAFLAGLSRVIGDNLPEGGPSLQVAARAMHVSERTLHRRLAERNINFQALVRQTRHRLARLYLEDVTLSLNDVAFLLGYSEQSAFTRAFRQWQGTTPYRYRKSSIH
jgi:AraC-like DNA-binding protein